MVLSKFFNKLFHLSRVKNATCCYNHGFPRTGCGVFYQRQNSSSITIFRVPNFAEHDMFTIKLWKRGQGYIKLTRVAVFPYNEPVVEGTR